MKKNEYERLLVRMFIIESLGERLYETLCSKCDDMNLRSVYQRLAINEKQTRDCIERELISHNRPLPIGRTKLITNIIQPFMTAIPLQWLLSVLARILKKRMYSNWHEKYHYLNAGVWMQLLEHEKLQHDILDFPK